MEVSSSIESGELWGAAGTMSEETISLELLGARVLTLTAEVRDLRHRLDGLERRMTALEHRFTALEYRFSAMEHRISAMEERFAVQEERMSAMLAVIVRVAERLDGAPRPPSG
jgi:predicted  nucleic acid-binding Zn-ribbon protein